MNSAVTVQFSSVAHSCPTLSTPWPTAHQASLSITNSRSLLKLMSIESVMPSSHPILYHPLLLSTSISQHQSLFKWVSSSHQVAQVLKFQLQHQYFQWIFRTDFLLDWLVDSPCSSRDSQVFSNTTVQKHQLFGTQLSLWSNSHIHTWLMFIEYLPLPVIVEVLSYILSFHSHNFMK